MSFYIITGENDNNLTILAEINTLLKLFSPFSFYLFLKVATRKWKIIDVFHVCACVILLWDGAALESWGRGLQGSPFLYISFPPFTSMS